VVFERGSGRIDYLLIRNGAGIALGNEPKAVPWNMLAQLPKDKGTPLVLTLDAQRLASAPFFGATKARQRPQNPNPDYVFQHVPPTGDTGAGTLPQR